MVTIKSYEIAQLFGLKFLGFEEDTHMYHTDSFFLFEFHNARISIREGYGDDDASDLEEAREEAAKIVLVAIGKAAAKTM